MFRSVPMVRLRVQLPSRDAARATRAIAASGLLHLVDIAHGSVLPVSASGAAEDLLPAFRSLSSRIRRAAARLAVPLPELSGSLPVPECEDFGLERDDIEAAAVEIEKSSEKVWAETELSAKRVEDLREAVRKAGRLQAAGVPSGRLARLRFSLVRIVSARDEDLLALSRLLPPVPFAILPLERAGGSRLASIAVPLSMRDRLEEALRLVPCEQFPIATPSESEPPIEEALRAAEHLKEELDRRRQQESTNRRDEIVALARRIDVDTLLLQAQTCFASAGRFVVIAGWVPEESSSRLVASIRASAGAEAIVDIEKPEESAEARDGVLRAPILYRNPILLRPFQSLVNFYGTPSYSEVEPTAFFAFSFLLMFGLMFGDVGHGLVLSSAGFLLFRYFPRFLDYGILLMEAGASSAVFGVLYGSLFGIEGLLPILWMSPLNDLRRFLVLAVGLGVVLVTVGLILNVVNGWKSGDRINAILGPRGVFGAFVYWVLLALLLRALVPGSLVLPSWVLFALLGGSLLLLALRPWLVKLLRPAGASRGPSPAGPPWLTLLESSVELVDSIFSYLANTLSFLRVAAFAAVHAGVFLAVFALADTMASFRWGGVLSVAALVAGNAVIILLEGLAVSVQVLRLEYYEFFGKFFRGGGEAYRPFTLRSVAQKGDSA